MITDKRKTLGVFMNKADQNFQNTVQKVTRQRAREFGYDIYYFFTVGYRESSNFYDEQEKSMFDFAPIEKLDGVLVTPDAYDMPGFRESLFDMLDKRATCPVVCVRDHLSQYDSFYTDEEKALRPLMRHLLEEHGFRKICFLAGYKEHPHSNARLACYKDEMEKHGVPLPTNAVFYGSMWSRGIDLAYDYFYGDPDNWPEAVVCANDYMAHALIEEIQKHGYNVPGDTVVTGFDDIAASKRSVPSLTTVGQDYVKMVNLAMERLHACIQQKEQGATEIESLHKGIQGALAIRESCGCAPRPDAAHLSAEVHRIEQENREMGQREVSQTYFAIELNSADSYEAVHETIFRKMEDIPTVRDFYLCLFCDEKGFAGHITPQAQMISAIRDRQNAGMPMTIFDKESLLPPSAERADEPQAFYVHLLHQRHNTYGYTVMQFNGDATPSQFYLHWNVIISIALRNLDYQSKLQALYEERRRSSITDALTGLNNRRGLTERVEPLWQDLCSQGRTVCFVSMDLDNLKPINDTFGHQGGDEALRTIADGIRAAVPENGVAARIGGDEYLIFMPDCDEDDAAAFQGRFTSYLAEHNQHSRFPVGASVGTWVAKLEEGMTLDRCVGESDASLYRAKNLRHAELEAHARSFGGKRRNYAKE